MSPESKANYVLLGIAIIVSLLVWVGNTDFVLFKKFVFSAVFGGVGVLLWFSLRAIFRDKEDDE